MTSSDFETDRTDQAMPLDPDPAVPGVDTYTPGVPAGSDTPSGESDFVDGVEGLGSGGHPSTQPSGTEVAGTHGRQSKVA